MPQPPDYSDICRPILLITGGRDCLREAGFGPDLQKQIPGSELCVMAEAGHCPHIEESQKVNARIIRFLGGFLCALLGAKSDLDCGIPSHNSTDASPIPMRTIPPTIF